MNVTKVSKEFIRMKPRGNPDFLENPFFRDASPEHGRWSLRAVSNSMRILKDTAFMIDQALRVPISFALESLTGIKYSKRHEPINSTKRTHLR